MRGAKGPEDKNRSGQCPWRVRGFTVDNLFVVCTIYNVIVNILLLYSIAI